MRVAGEGDRSVRPDRLAVLWKEADLENTPNYRSRWTRTWSELCRSEAITEALLIQIINRKKHQYVV